jgi:hypothetical protein
MTTANELTGDPRYYKHISVLIMLVLLGTSVILLFLNSSFGQTILLKYLGTRTAFCFQLFFWGALGAAIASSLFLAEDKKQNELELVKASPDPSLLSYPNEIDVHLYCHRIVTSACLAVVGAFFLYAGLTYFDVPADLPNPKHQAFFILFAVLIGLYQANFVAFLHKRFQKMLEKSGPGPLPKRSTHK